MTMAKQQPLTAKQQEILQAAEAVKELATTIIDGLTEALGVEEEAAPAKASTKAPAKGKAKPATEPEPEEEPEEEEGEEEGLTLEDLEAMDIKELLEVAKESGVEIPAKARKNKDAIVEILASLLEEGEEEGEDDGEGEEDGLSEDELRAMSLKEVKEVAAEMGIEIPKNIASKKNDIVDLILEASAGEEEPEEGEEGEEEEFEASEERLAAEEAVLEAVTSQVEAGELTLKDMRTYLAGLYEGNAECAACAKGKGACAKEKVIECYAMALQNFIDDDGEEHEEQDCYIRNGQYHCCGLPCEADPDDEGNVICSACGETYGVE